MLFPFLYNNHYHKYLINTKRLWMVSVTTRNKYMLSS